MQVTVYKDFLAIRFIRCNSPVPHTTMMAGGAGISLTSALARCESEVIERAFEINELRPSGIRPVGIAAHPNREEAHKKATQEAIESLCLEQIQAEKMFRCLARFRFFGASFGLTKTSHGYFAMLVGSLNKQRFGVHSAASTVVGTLIKAWEEFRSIYFFKPRGENLKHFTKANYRFAQSEFESLSFKFDLRFVYQPLLSTLTTAADRRFDRHIVYLFKQQGESSL